jgi:hypothetical protein
MLLTWIETHRKNGSTLYGLIGEHKFATIFPFDKFADPSKHFMLQMYYPTLNGGAHNSGRATQQEAQDVAEQHVKHFFCECLGVSKKESDLLQKSVKRSIWSGLSSLALFIKQITE